MVETFGEEHSETKFARRLGLAGATNIGLGAMLGGGIYVISGIAAGMIGPAIVLAYLVAGILSVFTAVNYAELACSIPKQGGGYTFVHDVHGGSPAFATGWFLFIGNTVACGLYAIAVAHTLAVFIPDSTLMTVGIIAFILVVITAITNSVSVRGVASVLGILNILQTCVLILFIGAGVFFIDSSNLANIVAEGAGTFEFIATVSFVFISFVGFEMVTTASEEIKEPHKNIPRAIMLTILIATIVYMLATFVIVGVAGYQNVATSERPIADVFVLFSGKFGYFLGLAGMAASNYAALNATFLASSRVAYSLGRDNYFPQALQKVHPTRKVPLQALLLSLIVASAVALTGSAEFAAYLADFGYLVGLTLVNASVIGLRQKNLSVQGVFKGPFFPVFPILAIVSHLILVPFLHIEVLILGVIGTIIGIIVYYGYSRDKKHTHKVRVMTLDESKDKYPPVKMSLLKEHFNINEPIEEEIEPSLKDECKETVVEKHDDQKVKPECTETEDTKSPTEEKGPESMDEEITKSKEESAQDDTEKNSGAVQEESEDESE
ncbi:MAG: putative amino acid permease YhdG (modular protein) [Candidatus Thorarchaeota archaeon]|nr:MAG: putative amino acid permease YhdG (modular protein) [Candidatus Thorarchaeota archaeon]